MIGARKAFSLGVVTAALLFPAPLAQGAAGAAVAPIQPSTSLLASGTAGYCRGDTGVTVVVDFRALGGAVVVRCAPGPVGPGFSGLDALQQAGFTPSGTARWGLQFVCRINGRPGPEETLPVRDNPDYQEKCENTPPQSAYWGYWYADNGGSWRYSNQGANNRDAIPGGFEGWAFSLNGARPQPGVAPRRPSSSPSTSPPASASPSPSPSPSATRQPASSPPSSRPPASGSAADPGTSSTAGPDSSPRTSDVPSTAATGPPSRAPGPAGTPTGRGAGRAKAPDRGKRTPEPSPTAPTSPTSPTGATGSPPAGDVVVTGDLPAPPDAPDPGSPRGLLAGLAVLAALTTGAGVTAWRRSRHS